jgi:hypothetical protein
MLVVSFGAAPADAAGALDAKPTIPHAEPPPPFGGRTSKARLVAAAPTDEYPRSSACRLTKVEQPTCGRKRRELTYRVASLRSEGRSHHNPANLVIALAGFRPATAEHAQISSWRLKSSDSSSCQTRSAAHSPAASPSANVAEVSDTDCLRFVRTTCVAFVVGTCSAHSSPSLGASIPARRCFPEPRRAGLSPHHPFQWSSGQGPRTGPNMFRPMFHAPTLVNS